MKREKAAKKSVVVDADGDLIVPRKGEDDQEEVEIFLELSLRTPLTGVGAQLWRGALFLSDYLLANPDILRGARVLEVGAGVGLTALVAAAVGCGAASGRKAVAATDLESNLALLSRNLRRNCSRLVNGGECEDLFDIFPLDLTKEELPDSVLQGGYGVILGADIVYSDDLTDGLIRALGQLAQMRRITCLLSVEKRYVFTLADLQTTAPAYDRLKEGLSRSLPTAEVTEYSSDQVEQRFCYEASPDLVLLELRFPEPS